MVLQSVLELFSSHLHIPDSSGFSKTDVRVSKTTQTRQQGKKRMGGMAMSGSRELRPEAMGQAFNVFPATSGQTIAPWEVDA